MTKLVGQFTLESPPQILGYCPAIPRDKFTHGPVMSRRLNYRPGRYKKSLVC